MDWLIAAAVIYGVGVFVTLIVGVLVRSAAYPGDRDRVTGARLVFLSPVWPALVAVKARDAWHDFTGAADVDR